MLKYLGVKGYVVCKLLSSSFGKNVLCVDGKVEIVCVNEKASGVRRQQQVNLGTIHRCSL